MTLGTSIVNALAKTWVKPVSGLNGPLLDTYDL